MNIPMSMQALLTQFKKWRWDRQREQEMQAWAKARRQQQRAGSTSQSQKTQTLIFLCEEFFHPDLRGYGGFGKTVKNIAEHYNGAPSGDTRVALAFPQATNLVKQPESRKYHETSVVLRPDEGKLCTATLDKYGDLIASLNPRALISIDWYPSYAISSYALNATPLIVWIHDPRDREEWEKIAAIADEMRFRGLHSAHQLIALAREKSISIKRLFALQELLPRKIVFCTTARTLIPRAERTYAMSPIAAHWLPNPIEIPDVQVIEFSEKPCLLYLGRLDAVKRPWIAFELAKRYPDVDFLIAGQAHNVELMTPWIESYRHLPNLKLLGHVDGQAKDHLLRTCWGVLNTSVHEAEPVSFLEAFSYGKCIVSCHDPDSEVTKFGYFTGEVLGEGLDEAGIGRFSEQIKRLISNTKERRDKGQCAREEMLKNHTFHSFDNQLKAILDAEGI